MRNQRLKPPKLYRWILASIGVHIGVVLVYLVVVMSSFSFFDEKQVFDVRIVQLGKKRDETLLPRIVPQEENVEAPTHHDEPNPPAPPAPTPEPVPEPQKHQVTPTKPPEKKKPPSSNVNPLDVLKRRIKETEKEGNPEGARLGNSVTGDLMNNYLAEVQRILKEKGGTPATLTEKEKQTLKLVLKIWIDPSGNLMNVKIVSRSGNSYYDESVFKSVKEIGFFGAPPLTLRRLFQRDGEFVEVCPIKCPERN